MIMWLNFIALSKYHCLILQHQNHKTPEQNTKAMKAVFLFVLAAMLTSLQAEATSMPTAPAASQEALVSATDENSADWGPFKRKKYKYKKRRKASKNRRQHRMFGR
ncbi:hypothetical protein LGH70_20935 [Hymenobacter sp. BT635]|uniref:Mitochondrial mRNA-processing protein COX24 C-terminal domain-containing protein n=1 Tax=Hymenobacter nitidus TaxID=2880929 RepID=A0ABS8AHZ8_9BACT|nr:hypothetical protein [Hymenobacter nitidus]MCB2380073.1 hypothetical protein [Hymenobacter nitidus]